MNADKPNVILGWEEWVSLPDLGLPAIKAKVDTGAKTSALHAHLIEPFGPSSSPMVRFAVHPRPGRTDIEITCSARIIGRRLVTSSNGETEYRYVIRTRLAVGGREWPIEVTLSNRETMSYRMLLGREAIRGDVFVDPTASFRQPRLSYKPYRKLPRQDPVRRPLRIAILTRRQNTPSNRRLAKAARARGHVLEIIDLANLALRLGDGNPAVLALGKALPHYDAVVPRLAAGRGPFAAAAVRQFELMGSHAVNSGDALDRIAGPLAVLQLLDASGIQVHAPPVLDELMLRTSPPLRSRGARYHFLVVGHRAIGVIERTGGAPTTGQLANLAEEARLAERASRALDLGLAEIVVGRRGGRAAVLSVSAMPALAEFEALGGSHVAKAIVAEIELRVRSWVKHGGPLAERGGEGSDSEA